MNMTRNYSRLNTFFFVLLLTFSLLITSTPSFLLAATTPKLFEFVEITDFHGYLQNSAKLSDGTVIVQQRAGVLAKQLTNIKTGNPNTVILSGGDMFQGTPLSNILKGQPVIDMMKSIGFDAMALGNHEYDWGIDTVIDSRKATLKNSEIPVLAANVYDKKTGQLVNYVKPYVILEKDSVKIGIIGVVDNQEFPSIIMPSYVQNVNFKNPVPIVNELAAKLRSQGVQIILVLAHMGAISYKTGVTGNLADFASKVTGVDAIFGGHTHTIVATRIKGIPLGVAGSSGQGYLDLKMALAPDGKVTSADMTYIDDTGLYNTPNPVVDTKVQTIVDKANQEVGPKFNEVIGVATTDLTRTPGTQPYGDSALGNWAAEVTRKAVNADFGFANNGGLRIDIPKGNITVGTIFQCMPFDNTIVALKMTGAQIKVLLEQAVMDNGKGIQLAGLSFKYDPAKPSMQRVFEVRKSNHALLNLKALYLVATNNFMGSGGDGFTEFTDPTVAKTYTDSYKLVRDALIDAVKLQKNVTSTIDNRIIPGQMR
jgi:2',3'-cyclic-nucleotide 2'-phosphodiesterase/3'-nucleotidase/5'-nucleotidase